MRPVKRVKLCPCHRRLPGALETALVARVQVAMGALRTVLRGFQPAPEGTRGILVGVERRWRAPRNGFDGFRELRLSRLLLPHKWGEGPWQLASEEGREMQRMLQQQIVARVCREETRR